MKGARRLAAAVAVICQREFTFALILQRNGAHGWEQRDQATRWRTFLSDETLEMMDAATASGAWKPDVEGAGMAAGQGQNDPFRIRTVHDACDIALKLVRGRG